MKQFAVIGLGNFGFNVAANLYKEGNDVLAIDIRKERVEEIEKYVTNAVIGDAKNKNLLEEFINPKINSVVVSIGKSMIESVIIVHFLNELKTNHIIVKAMNADHANILKIVGASEIILPEKDMAEQLSKRLTYPNILDQLLLTSDYVIAEYVMPDKFSGKKINEIKMRNKYNILIIAVREILEDKFTLMPAADYILQPDSLLLMMGKKEDMMKLKNL
jgi:trk system potassium uptake protein TrkA